MVTVEQGSDAEVDELIAVAVLTIPGERIQVPTFGVNDPAFEGFELGSLQRHLMDFGPPVIVTAVEASRRSDDREELDISWIRTEASTQEVA